MIVNGFDKRMHEWANMRAGEWPSSHKPYTGDSDPHRAKTALASLMRRYVATLALKYFDHSEAALELATTISITLFDQGFSSEVSARKGGG